jgi:hypothetical protein
MALLTLLLTNMLPSAYADQRSSFANYFSHHPLPLLNYSLLEPRDLDGLPLPTLRPRPIPNSYWATPFLLACEYPWSPYTSSHPKLDALLAAGVRTFIDLTESGELSPYLPHLPERAALLAIHPSDIEYHRFPIPDRSLPSSAEDMSAILNVLSLNERRGRTAAVHCRGGIGRTGMVVGCWLVQSGRVKTGLEALRVIDREWQTVEKCTRFPQSPETGAQFEFVKNFVKRLPVQVQGWCVFFLLFFFFFRPIFTFYSDIRSIEQLDVILYIPPFPT